MESSRWDAIVVGGGHNGLVAAAYLARQGLKVLVAERRQVLGGAAASEAVFPGFLANTGAGDAGLFLPEIVADLQLQDCGLRFLESPALLVSLLPEGEALTFWRDPGLTQREIARFSPADAESYPRFLDWLKRARAVLRPIMTLAPPALPDLHVGELLPWLGPGLRLRRQGGKQMMELLRALPMPASNWLDEWFETPALKGALAGAMLRGARLGVKAPGTTFLMLYHTLGAGEGRAARGEFMASRFVQGGSGSLSAAVAESARRYGAEICTGMDVRRLLVEDGRTVGVELESGVVLNAPIVVSSADPRSTFFGLVGAPNLEVRFVREVQNIRLQGSLARLMLTLEELPRFKAFANGYPLNERLVLGAHLVICPGLDYQERASDAAKYGRLPDQPVLDVLIPSLLDPALAPAGKHLLTVDITHVPYQPEGGSWEDFRSVLADLVIEMLETHAPGLRLLISGCELLTPQDYEREYGLAGGDPYHGQMGLDQLMFMRPVPGYARYRTPVQGLYLCGSGAHPGGGLTGAPGYNAAREILKDR